MIRSTEGPLRLILTRAPRLFRTCSRLLPSNLEGPLVCVSADQRPFVRSPDWTRTNNPPVNSRMLCQLSYRGSLVQREKP